MVKRPVIVLSLLCGLVAGVLPAISQTSQPDTAPATAPVVKKKPPAPTAAALQASLATVDEVYKAELKAATASEQKSALAHKIAETAKDDAIAISRYALLTRALDLAVAGGNFPLASTTIDAMSEDYSIDVLKMNLDAATAVTKSARGAVLRRALAAGLEPVIDRAVAEDRFDVAGPLADSALNAARASEDAALARRMMEKAATVKEAAAAYAKLKPALAALEKDPADAAANLEAGQYHCFFKGNWAEGLPQLAKGSNAEYKKLAEAELLKPAKSAEQMALADGWWEVGQKQTGVAKSQVLGHAGQWYRLTAGELTGLLKVKVEKRLAEAAVAAAPVVHPGGTVAAATKTINLMELFNNDTVVAGNWTLKDGTLTSDAEMGARVEFPYEPPAEYDYHIVFTRLSGDDGICQILAANGRNFSWGMGSKANMYGGLEFIGGKDKVMNKTRIDLPITQGEKYDSVVQIRKDFARVLINGKQVLVYKTDFSDFSIYEGWKLRSGKTLGIGSWRSSIVFYKIEVTEVTGAGKLLTK